MKKKLVASLSLALVGMALASDSSTVAALRRALDGGCADWKMERRIGENGPLLESSGTVDCISGSGIVWRVTSPFSTSVAMTTNAMVFVDEDGTRTRSLDELPHYSEIRERTDAFVAGNINAFDGLFRLSSISFPDGGWRLVMIPEIAAIKRLFSEIELAGKELPTKVVLKTADGGSCAIRFSPQAHTRK